MLVGKDAAALGEAVAGPDQGRRERLLGVMVGDPADPAVALAAEEMAGELWQWINVAGEPGTIRAIWAQLSELGAVRCPVCIGSRQETPGAPRSGTISAEISRSVGLLVQAVYFSPDRLEDGPPARRASGQLPD